MTQAGRTGRIFAPALAAALLFLPRPAAGGEVVAVLSSDSGHYLEAYAAFKEAFPGEADMLDASVRDFKLPEDVRYAAAFGARATALKYPPGTHIVYALAPVVSGNPHWHQIPLAPPPGDALAAYKGLQPGLARLAVLWSAYPGEDYLDELRAAGGKAGVEVISVRLKSPDSLPERLRRLMGQVDAFWLMPDPVLITQDSLMLLASFSCSNSIPFYAPTNALVLAGATATFSHDFRDAGEAAAAAVAALKAGKKLPGRIYTGKARLNVNEDLREKCRWPIK